MLIHFLLPTFKFKTYILNNIFPVTFYKLLGLNVMRCLEFSFSVFDLPFFDNRKIKCILHFSDFSVFPVRWITFGPQNKTKQKKKQKRVHVSLLPLSYLPLDVLFSFTIFFWTIQKQVKKISHFSDFQSGF